MANKRIQKKRAKAEMLRDKSKFIASFVVFLDPGATRSEYRRMAKSLWKLDMNALFGLSFEVIHGQIMRSVSLMKIMPRKTLDASKLVNWRSITSGS